MERDLTRLRDPDERDETAMRSVAGRVPAAEREAPPADLVSVMAGLKEDRDLLRKLVVTFLEQRGPALAEMRGAVEMNDSEALARAAHRIRGTLTIFRAEEASELTRRIEETAERGDVSGARALLSDLDEQVDRLARFLSEAVGVPPDADRNDSMP
jgi:HPt (histidine-containing phosphotransfer) domain-containing protein